MNSRKPPKRKRGTNPMVEGDVRLAKAVKPKIITETKKDGRTVTKQVWISMDTPTPKLTTEANAEDTPTFGYEPQNMSPPADTSSPLPGRTNTYRKQKDYIQQYVDRMDEFLSALISHEGMPEGAGICRNCDKELLAVWKCKECITSRPMCRACMRLSHIDNPFHRIEQWNGAYFRPAELWEVGTYLLVRHHEGEGACETIRQYCEFLEQREETKDAAEQHHLRESSMPEPAPQPMPEFDDNEEPLDMGAGEDDVNDEDDFDEDELEDELEDVGISNPYLDTYPRAYAGPGCSANAGTNPLFDAGYSANAGSTTNAGSGTNLSSGSGPHTGAYLRVVHSNGLHHIAMVSCHCRGDDVLPLDLFAAQLIPASLKRIKTVFTAQVLDMFRLSNLELKASAYQFYQLLRRLTRPMAPAEVDNLYREFRRMSRLWRWMKKLKWAGYAGSTKPVNDVSTGELAIYCPACPQPGINIPDDWKEDPARHTNRWVYKRIFVADGNFKADHVRQQHEAGDVWLSEGSGMIPQRQEYLSFLASAIEKLTKAPCENTFRAITNALQASKLCDVTGLVSVACGRHGCYAPQALVDLFKGEQQKNVDFAFLKALKSTSVAPEQGVLLIYDIACQYYVHLQNRIGSKLPFGLDVDVAIGLFHIHAHKDQCFFQYATSFIPGAAIVAGEILESLWSSLNSISPTARTATLAHRAEMLDDHATDSNHKKTLGIISSLCRTHRTAVDMLDHARTYFRNLSDEASTMAVEKWTDEIESAERKRKFDLTAMDIYGAKLEDSIQEHPEPATGITPKSPLASWMDLSMTVEEKQLEIQAKVRQMGQNPSNSDRQIVETAREQLTGLLLELKNAMHAAGVAESTLTTPTHEPLGMWDEILYEPVPNGPNTMPEVDELLSTLNKPISSIGPIQVEEQLIPLPSNGNIEQAYAQLEITHRIAHAEHHLNRIRDLIAEKSFQYSHVIRVSPRKGVNTKSRAAVKKLNLEISVHCRLYTQCRSKLLRLGADTTTLNRFQTLSVEDVKSSTAIVNPNEPGSTQIKLSWIWQTAGGHRWGLASGTETGAGSEAGTSVNVFEFRRVHWLRARAQLKRWQEEVTLTGYEMQWTVRYFHYKSRIWDILPRPGPGITISTPSGINTGTSPKLTAGAVAYRRRKQAMWENIMMKADSIFGKCNISYESPL